MPLGQKSNTIVSGLRACHFQTSASMGFFKEKNYKKIPLVFQFQKSKTLPNVVILYPKTCVTDNDRFLNRPKSIMCTQNDDATTYTDAGYDVHK